MSGLIGGGAPCDATMQAVSSIGERNSYPDSFTRELTRLSLSAQLRSLNKSSFEEQTADLVGFAQSLKTMPIAIETDTPNSQHYELPNSFFKLVLGDHMKYSAGYYRDASDTLADAEKAMLELYCERAQVKDGHTILDLGCGWGSLCLFIAEKYSNCKVTGLTYSKTQKEYIDALCGERKLKNVDIIFADISTYKMEASFDRVFSIEMLEYMRNYKELLKKISKWMKDDGLFFVHHVCHKAFAYLCKDTNEELQLSFGYEWLARNFLGGVTMLSANLLLYFQDDVSVLNHWLLSGNHFSRTSELWLKKMDQNLPAIKPIIETIYGKDDADKWTAYWRTFFISLAEMFGYNNGEEWMDVHILFTKK